MIIYVPKPGQLHKQIKTRNSSPWRSFSTDQNGRNEVKHFDNVLSSYTEMVSQAGMEMHVMQQWYLPWPSFLFREKTQILCSNPNFA